MEGKIFVPKAYCLNYRTKPIVFDSGYTVAVTPHIEGFIPLPTKVKKTMNELLSVASMAEGMVEWYLLDNYRVSQ